MKPAERVEGLNYAERWLRDGLRAIEPPGGLLTTEVDMTAVSDFRDSLRQSGVTVSYTHFLVAAISAALSNHPELHKLTAGNRRLSPDSIDVCLSIAGDHALTPVLILKDAGNKSLQAIAQEVRDRAPLARAEEEKLVAALCRWGWIVPLAFLRRGLIRFLLNRLSYRRMVSGTFQVTVVPSVDVAVPFLFNTAAALGAGRVRDRVVAVDGKVEIRPVLTLACCCDHKVWNGMDTAKFLNAVRKELEEWPAEKL